MHGEWRLPLQTLIATETVTKPAFQWEKQKGLIAEKAQKIGAVRSEDPRRAAAPTEKGKAAVLFQIYTLESHIPTPLTPG